MTSPSLRAGLEPEPASSSTSTSQPTSPLPLLIPTSSSLFVSRHFLHTCSLHLQWKSPAALTQVHEDRRRSIRCSRLANGTDTNRVSTHTSVRAKKFPRCSLACIVAESLRTLKANGIPKSTRNRTGRTKETTIRSLQALSRRGRCIVASKAHTTVHSWHLVLPSSLSPCPGGLAANPTRCAARGPCWLLVVCDGV